MVSPSSLFWLLILAHLFADYPLQSNWMVKAKRTWPGLTLHVGIHLITLLLLMWPATTIIWPQIMALVGMHFAIDAFKNFMAKRKPTWVVAPYIWDQGLHLLSIWLVAGWMATSAPDSRSFLPETWAAIASGYLLATYVWTITERVLAHADPALGEYVRDTAWSRLLMRGGLLTVLLILAGQGTGIRLGMTMGLAVVGWRMPTLSTPNGRRVILADLAVVVVVALLVLAAL